MSNTPKKNKKPTGRSPSRSRWPAGSTATTTSWSKKAKKAKKANAARGCKRHRENPLASPGYLCVYVGHRAGSSTYFEVRNPAEFNAGAATSGAYIFLIATPFEINHGTWAVTAP